MRKPPETKGDVLGALAGSVERTIAYVRGVVDDLHGAVVADIEAADRGEIKHLGMLRRLETRCIDEVSRGNSPIHGLGFAAEPAAFTEPGLAWWYRNLDGEIRRLGVRMKPGTINFYDYTETEWWRNSSADDREHIFGPYVDHSGTNAYVITFARRVSRNADFSGVVVLDIMVSKLQAMWQAPLRNLPKPSSVINGEGLVIATNDSRLLASTINPSNSLDRIGVESTDWSILRGNAMASVKS
jgi:hypothetical protein